jgi:restriction system protein
MPRSSRRRRKSVDAFVRQAIIWLIAAAVVVFAFSVLASEQPVIAVALLAAVVIVPVLLWRRRRLARRAEARFRVQQAQHIGGLLTVSGGEFEQIVADQFRALGYDDVERIGGSGDLGVDLLATDPAGLTVVIQCKRYGRGQKVGSPATQLLMGAVVNRGADRGIFVTTSSFTAPAIEHAKAARVPLTLIDGDGITRLALQASAAPNETEVHASIPQPVAPVGDLSDSYST